MAELHYPGRESLAEAVKALVERHGGPSKVARRVSVDRSRVHAWMRGEISIDRLAQLAETLDEPITVRFGPDTTKEALRPEWAEGLEGRVAEAVITRLASPTRMDAALHGLEQLIALQRQSDESHGAGTESPDPVEEAP